MSKKKNNAANNGEKENKLSLQKVEDTAAETEKEAENEAVEAAEEAVIEAAEKADEAPAEESPAEPAEEASESAADEDSDDKDEDTEDTEDIEDKEEKPKKQLSPEKQQKKAEAAARRSFKARAFKKGWFSIALVALFIAGVIVLNMIASALVDKVPALVADTTGSGSFDLSEDTLDYINKLGEQIRIIVLCDEKTYREGGEYYIQANSLLHKYADNSSHITLEFLDLASNPTFTSQYPDESLTQYSIIVQGENDYRYLKTTDYFDVQIDYTSYQYYIAGSKVEEAVTSAILNVTLDDKPTVGFISDISDESYDAFKTYLSNNGFETEDISPAVGEIGEDVDILVLFAPNIDLDSAYVDKISAFLNNNGEYGKQLLYMPSSSLAARPNIDSLLEEWGLSVEQGYAVENDMSKISQITYGVYLFATEYTDSTYTAKMKNSNLPVCVLYGNGVYTHPVNILDENNVVSLLKLSEQSTVIYPPDTADNAEPEEENRPSLAVGAIATKGSTASSEDTDTDGADTETTQSNIIVLGSNYIVTDTFMSSNLYGNAAYMLSLLNTLVGRDNVGISIGTQSLDSEVLSVTSAQLRVLTVLFVMLIPLAVLIAGIVIFIKRRNL